MFSDHKRRSERGDDSMPLRSLTPSTSPFPSPSPSPDPTVSRSTYPLGHQKRSPDYWAWEWFALVVSFLAIAATSVVLVMFDGKPIPAWSWSKKGISVNAILSLLSTLSRASLLVPIDQCMGQLMWLWFASHERRLADLEIYNQASRGPVGAAKLLWRQKGIGLGCLGGLLMVASIGIGVTQQQLLSYPVRQVVQPNSTSTITRAQRFDTYQNVTSSSPNETSYDTSPEISFSLLSAIYNAALMTADEDDETTTDDIVERSTINQPFFTCTSGKCDFPPFPTLAVCSECHDADEQVQQTCDATQCTVQFGTLQGQSWKSPDGNRINTILNQSYLDPLSSTTLKGLAGRSPFASLAVLRSYNAATEFPPRYQGTECALFWCVKSIQAKVVKGVYSEEVTAITTDIKNTTSGGREIAAANGTDVLTFTITSWADKSFSRWDKGVTNVLTGWARASRGDSAFSSDIMQGFHVNTNTSFVMAKLAMALTNRIRDFDTSTVPVNGTTMINESFIRVRWQWIIYPTAIWVASLAFLITIVVKSREAELKKGMRVWGANSLALLYYGLDAHTRARVPPFGEWEQMKELGDRLWVKLEPGTDGLKLRAKKVK